MIKTVKGKVIAGTMAIGLLSSAGVALGATDAGTHIKGWYDKQFGQASANVETNYSGYQKDKIEGFNQVITDLKDSSTKSIVGVGERSTTKSNQNIDAQKKEHIAAINKEKASIEGYMASQFKKLSEEASVKINSAADTAWTDADAAMVKHIDAEGATTRASMKKELEATTATAVSELKKAIDDAKLELQKQLDSKTTATVKELKDLIDTRINKLSGDIETKTNKLLGWQYAYITTDAANLEKAALKEMKDLVDAINK